MTTAQLHSEEQENFNRFKNFIKVILIVTGIMLGMIIVNIYY
jgi:hypothetical protein